MSAMPAPVAGIPRTTILVGDVRRGLATLPDQSVHCIVTSPPYWGLRDYGTGRWQGGDPACNHKTRRPSTIAKSQASSTLASTSRATVGHGEAGYHDACRRCGAVRIDDQFGMEPTPALYIANLMAVFRECWRVLRDDGSLFLNIDDSYAGSGRGPTAASSRVQHATRQGFISTGPSRAPGIRAKSLMLIPERLLLALSDDGWVVRDRIVWHKTASMPENVTDRCTDAWEPVFHLTKRGRYYADMEAVKQPAAGNLRNVWTLGPEPFGDAHFATFPAELPRRCIKIGTSERGVCPRCGKGWVRVMDHNTKDAPGGGAFRATTPGAETSPTSIFRTKTVSVPLTLGWQPACKCNAGEPVPATVLDPFGGAMTTALVANQLGRDSINIELNPSYADMGRRRILADAGMLCDIHVIEVP